MSNLYKLKKLAKAIGVLTNNSGVQVTVSGDTAFSTNGRINIPHGDFSDPKYMIMCQGYIDHELGHESYTDHSFMGKANQTHPGNLVSSILNALEDARMENEISKAYPGARINLQNVWTLLVENGDIPCPSTMQDPIQIIFSYILHKGRQLICGYYKTHTDLALNIIENNCGKAFANEFELILEKLTKCNSTGDVYALSVEIYEFLQRDQDDSNDTGNSSDDDSNETSDDDSNETSDDDSNGAGNSSDDDSDENSDDDSNGAGNGSGDDSDDDSNGNGGNSSGNSNGAEDDKDSSNEANKSFTQALPGSDLSDEYEYHDAIKGALKDSAIDELNSNEEGFSDYKIDSCDISSYVRDTYIADGWKSLSSKFARTLQRVLIDKSDSLKMSTSSGSKLLTRKLASIAAGNSNVFEYKEESEAAQSSVMLLVDSSGSMASESECGGTNMEQANKTALAFAKSFTRMGIDVEVNYFGVEYAGLDRIYTAKKFGKKLEPRRFGVPATGTTPTHNALFHGLVNMINQPSENKIVFLITDGQANSAYLLPPMVENMKKAGVKLVTIALGNFAVYGLDDAVYAADANSVNEALKQAVKRKLFN
tara:strand:- start:12686 stop:14467 length:1782 start_codon:yes stop_codon:yes gene_type:complete